MTDILKDVQGFLKLESVATDNTVFRLHYKATTILLVTLSLLVTQKQYIGDPIDCIQDKIDDSIMDTYCWIHSTFTIPDLRGVVGKHIPHPGVANPVLHGPDDLYDVKQHKYYQWVTLVLYLQAIMFYFGRYLWKIWEGGKVKMLLMDLNKPVYITDHATQDNLVDYFKKNLRKNSSYFWRFFFCEILNLANVIGQMFFTDLFLGNEFLEYGTKVFEFNNQEIGSRIDPMDAVFPKVAKCTFHKYGVSGTVERHDSLCVLPINILNEKIYIILWFWFIILAAITGIHFIYRLSTIIFPEVRCHLIKDRARMVHPDSIRALNRQCGIGDWFLLYQLAKNMDPFLYKEFLEKLSDAVTVDIKPPNYNSVVKS